MMSCSGFCGACGSEASWRRRHLSQTGLGTEGRMGRQGGLLPSQIGSAIQQALGGGRSLEGALRERMSACLNHDFGDVRVHTGPEAGELNRRLGARAFTVGSDIFFADGAYDPTSRSGRELIAHELVHVAQQGQGASSGALPVMTVSSADDPLEHEAVSLAARAVSHARQPSIKIRLKAAYSRTVLRAALSVECKTAAPMSVPCHTATLWWIYRTQHPDAGRDMPAFNTFVTALGDDSASDLIADLIQNYGVEKTWKLWYTSTLNAVVVLAEGKTAAGVVQGHSCVCAESNNLYGHNQGGWFSTCKHGVTGAHCHHWGSRVKLKKGYKLYEVASGNVAKWAAAHF